MHRPTLIEKLIPFEVFAEREMGAGRPIVARVIGRKFDQLLDGDRYERPYDPGFGKAMVKTASYLLTTLGASFGYAELTEISLFAVAGGGDARRLLSRIAGAASGKLSLLLGEIVTFEARLYEFPDLDLAQEYFRWRQSEAHLRAIDRYCVHLLHQQGTDHTAVHQILDGLGPDEKVELLRQNALEFQSLPTWQRHGSTVRVRPGESEGLRLVVDLNLPFDSEFGDYLKLALA
jgi:tRNA(His) guanylyltransferase